MAKKHEEDLARLVRDKSAAENGFQKRQAELEQKLAENVSQVGVFVLNLVLSSNFEPYCSKIMGHGRVSTGISKWVL